MNGMPNHLDKSRICLILVSDTSGRGSKENTDMKIAICDDDIRMVRQIEELVRSFFVGSGQDMPEVCTFTEGAALLAGGDFDIVYLDMEMPGIGGVEVGRQLKSRNRHVIIIVITSYMDYLDDALRFNTFRYLSKPIVPARFDRNLKEAIRQYMSKSRPVVIETPSGTVSLRSGDIIMIESDGHGSTVHTANDDIRCAVTMSDWMERLGSGSFFAPHRSFIVNMGYVTGFTHDEIELCGGGHRVFLSRRRYNDFKKNYLLYLEVND